MKRIAMVAIMCMLMPFSWAQENAPGLPEVENLQDFYRTGVGVRVGWPIIGLTAKHFITKRTALEFIVAHQFRGASLTVLAERHHATRRPGIYWYYGAGADIGRFEGSAFRDLDGDYYTEEHIVTAGLVAVLGIEANIHETPFSVGFDLKPHIGLHNPGGSILEAAVTLKYIWSW